MTTPIPPSPDAAPAGPPPPDALSCKRCREAREADDLDRQLWCDRCRMAARRTAANWGRLVGLLGAAGLALWIGFGLRPEGPFLVVWAGIVIVAYRILGRLGQELVYGAIRARAKPVDYGEARRR